MLVDIKKKALVIEDEPIISRVCQRVLTGEGYEVDIAMNGLVAMQRVKEKSYDLCLSDIRTPGMNGIEFYRHLEETNSALIQNLIFTTGDVLSGNVEEFLERVKRPYLAKPFNPDDLIAIVSKVQETARK
jgi:CheY-like chemotaxis protein